MDDLFPIEINGMNGLHDHTEHYSDEELDAVSGKDFH